jgi:hypothetical protein
MSKLKQALEKAKKDRGEFERGNVQRIEPVEFKTEHAFQALDKPLKPVYSSTKVIRCDADLLNRNRVVSVCTRDEADRLKILRNLRVRDRFGQEAGAGGGDFGYS